MRWSLLSLTLTFSIAGAVHAVDRPSASSPRPVELTPRGTIAGAKQPQAVVVGGDKVHVTFAGGESVYLVSSTDGGKSFDSPRRVDEIPGLMAGMHRGPRIAADDRAIVMSAIGSKEGNLLAWRSVDGGKSWEGPSTVNDEPKPCREGLHAMAMGPRGQIACVWLDLRQKKTELYCAVSTDGGATWGENRLAYRSPDGFICECCHPSAAYDSSGTLFVMWRNQIAGNRDLYLASSRDDGKTFSPGSKLGTGTWKKDACPMDGGALAVASPGKTVTIWRRDQEVFYTPAGETKELRLGLGEQPTATVTTAGTYLAWVTRRPGSLMVKVPSSGKPIELASGVLDPMLASAPTGTGPVVIVWETGKGRDTSIWFASLTLTSR